ncbi:MAG: hypothetical protein LRZ85_07515 [Alphaproteobacteria bacterium]|nr:hypothetical protein [Alphaproteobacteria bacterium]MCD8570535.1 hypothetical protein [Alphaproteobacteria bacterium]
MNTKNTNIILGILAIVVVVAAGAYALNMPDNRSAGEHIGDAVNKLDEGVDDAARELEDRTPLERMQDDYEDATDGSPE